MITELDDIFRKYSGLGILTNASSSWDCVSICSLFFSLTNWVVLKSDCYAVIVGRGNRSIKPRYRLVLYAISDANW